VPVRYQRDAIDGYMDWYRRISHPIIQNPSNRFLAPGHARGEDVDAIVLAQVTYVNFCFYPACYFLNISYIFTTTNSS